MSKKSELKRKYQALKDAIRDYCVEKINFYYDDEPIRKVDNAFYKFMGAVSEQQYHEISKIMDDLDNE